MKTTFSNEELSHVWASQSQDHGKNANNSFYFEGATIYSYGCHFPIARFVAPKVVLFNCESNSNATAKRQSLVRRAVGHCRVLRIEGLESSLTDHESIGRVALGNMQNALLEITERTRSQDKIDYALARANAFRDTAIYFGATVAELPNGKAGILAFVREAERGERIKAARNNIGRKLTEVDQILNGGLNELNHAESLMSSSAKTLESYSVPLPRGTKTALAKIKAAIPAARAAYEAQKAAEAIKGASWYLEQSRAISAKVSGIHAYNLRTSANQGLAYLKGVFNNPEAETMRAEFETFRDSAQKEINAEYLEFVDGVYNNENANDSHIQQAIAHYAETDTGKASILRARLEARHGEKVTAWRNGESVTLPRDIEPLLRFVNGADVETSWGARVPVSVTADLWRLVVIARAKGAIEFESDTGMRVGHYRLDHVKACGSLVIGCHTIDYSELELLAKQLGYIA